jgi:hypothetical protein
MPEEQGKNKAAVERGRLIIDVLESWEAQAA